MIIILAMFHPSAPTRHLYIPPLHRFNVAHTVLVTEFAREEVGEDFEFSMRVGGETCFGL